MNGAAARPLTRASNGLDQFFSSLRDQDGLSILDLSGASQANISFITGLGHRVCTDDILRTLEDAFGSGPDFLEQQNDPKRATRFLNESLDFAPNSFDGALLWDTLQFLSPALLHQTVAQLHRVMRPNAYLLAFFNAEEKAQSMPLYSYRISDPKMISLIPRGERRSIQFFNNRALEKLFQDFQSVKFFLTRDSLREIIVRR